MPKSKVYLETTIVSYVVTARSADLIQAAHQQATRNWWASRDVGTVPPIICTPEELMEPKS